MTYQKPELVALQSAISAIQQGTDSKIETVLDNRQKLSSVSAYEADE